jgi:hypothetical protein
MGRMPDCTNIIESTGKPCGSDTESPFHVRFCSDECADRVNSAELAELGLTPDVMREALNGYYECKEMIDQKETAAKQSSPETESHSPETSDR